MKTIYKVVAVIIIAIMGFSVLVFFSEDNASDWVETSQFMDGKWKQSVSIVYPNGNTKDMGYSLGLTIYNDEQEVVGVNWLLDAKVISTGSPSWDDVELDLSGVTVHKVIKSLEASNYPNSVLVQVENIGITSGGTSNGKIKLKNTGSNPNGIGTVTISGHYNPDIATIKDFIWISHFDEIVSNYDNTEGTFDIIVYGSGIYNDDSIDVCWIDWQGQSEGSSSLRIDYVRVTEATPESSPIYCISIDGTISHGVTGPIGGITIYDETSSVIPSTIIHSIDSTWFTVIDQGIDFTSLSGWETGEQYEVSFIPSGNILFRGVSGSQTGNWETTTVNGVVVYINNEN